MDVGIDLVEHNSIKDYERLAKRILSDLELEIYNSLGAEKRKIEYVASRFAAKEAYYKALGGVDKPYDFKSISILNHPNGKPYLYGDINSDSFKVSLSHTNNQSIAIVIRI